MGKIDLIYNYRAIDSVYVIYGPEKVNGNIVVSTEGYIVNSISEVINKINAMVATLSPEITNCQSISSGLYGNMNMQIWRGDLASGSSSSPDYTQILTNINTNLTNLNSKFVANGFTISDFVRGLFNSFNNTNVNNSSDNLKSNSFIFKLLRTITSDTINAEVGSYLYKILNCLKQSVSPNANITDVISALNTTIDSKQNTTVVNNEVTPLAEINIDVPFEVKNLKKSDVENL